MGVLPVPQGDGETRTDAVASNVIRPTVGGAITAMSYGRKYGDDLELAALIRALSEQARDVHGGDLKRAETMLTVQAHTLDAIFNELAQRAALNMGEYLSACETYLRLALKAQSQCRATLETLVAIKNPTPVAFVKQANIANGPQQVNNGAVSETVRAGARARDIECTQTKLSGTANELRPDTRTSALAGAANPQVATVGKIDGAEDAGR
jgi:hypothetical protein